MIVPVLLLLLLASIMVIWAHFRIDVLESDLKRLRRQLEVQ